MDHLRAKTYSIANRIGFHYFPDGLRFGEKDLEIWLPRLKELDAQWLVLKSPGNRAIPEEFIRALAQAKIKTILDLDFPLSAKPAWDDLETLLRSYGKWGLDYAILDQKPNSQSAWGSSFWKQADLAVAYAARFRHFAEIALDCGIKPVFAPLLPGGDFWDLAFLETALKTLSETSDAFILNNMILSAYAWDFDRSLNWGAGGAKIWQHVKAYKVPQGSQDQRGFRTYEWYAQISEKVLGKKLPMLTLQAGLRDDPFSHVSTDLSSGIVKQVAVYRLLRNENVFDPDNPEKLISAIGAEVLACSFYLLSDPSASSLNTWFNPDGTPAAVSSELLNQISKDRISRKSPPAMQTITPDFKFETYILISDSLRPRIREILHNLHPFISRSKPLVGFSADEAKQAANVLWIAYENNVSSDEIDKLKSGGSQVRVLDPESLAAVITETMR